MRQSEHRAEQALIRIASKSRVLEATLPSSPVSSNLLYRHDKWGKPKLSSEGRVYKARMIEILRRQWLFRTKGIAADRGFAWYLEIGVVLEWDRIYNKGWPDKAKSRFKRIDLTNFIKVAEDVLKEFLQIDDAQNFAVNAWKRAVREGESPHTYIQMFPIDLED